MGESQTTVKQSTQSTYCMIQFTENSRKYKIIIVTEIRSLVGGREGKTT